MNSPTNTLTTGRATLIAAAAAALALAGCATTPVSPAGSADARSKLTRLQSDPNLGSRAPAAIKEAEAAVSLAEAPLPAGDALGAHRVYLADRQVEIAMAKATTRYTEDQRAKLAEERASARLDARTREADQANARADIARDEAETQRMAAADSAQQADELQRQIAALQAEATERGLVVTLGDVLFATGRSDIQGAGNGNLDKLAAFLRQYPERSAEIEGHTDDVGSDRSNQALSERRADAVKSYLVQAGIGAERLTASGKGESQPVVDNASASSRQQNRRVEVIIANPPTSAPAVSGLTPSGDTSAPRQIRMSFRRGPCEAPATGTATAMLGNGTTE